jgi:N-acyl-L-homoserine lactone synthetase
MYRFKVVDTPELLNRLYHFRYGIALEAFNGYKENKEEIDIDVYDDYSVHFVALDEDDNICAATRFIVNSPIGYPTENNLDFELDKEIADNRDKLAEVSRIFISKDVRGFKNAKHLIHGLTDLIYIHIKKNDTRYIYGALESSFLKFLNMINIKYEAVGEGSEYYGFRYPCILKTEDLEKLNPRLSKNS